MTAAVLVVLGLVYALGYYCFAWWDGGILRRILMTACAAVVIYAITVFLREHDIKF